MTIERSLPGGPVSTNGPATGGERVPTSGNWNTQTREPQSCDHTILTCHHPRAERWLSVGGWVEVCGHCSETRRPSGSLWGAAARLLRREGDELLMFGEDGKTLYRRDPVRE